jgi:hypothetical protein
MAAIPFPPAARTRPGAAVAVATVLVALAAGCAAPRPPLAKYTVPMQGPTAKVVMRGSLVANDFYGVFLFDDAERCQGPRLVGAGRNGRDAPSTAFVAGRPSTVDYVMFSPTSSCRVRWSFTPQAGRTYLFTGRVVTGVPGAACAARLLDATDPDKIVPVAEAVRRDQGGSACLPSPQARALSASRPAGSRDEGDTAVLRPGAGDDDLKGLIAP